MFRIMYSVLKYFWLEDYLKFYYCHIGESDEINGEVFSVFLLFL